MDTAQEFAKEKQLAFTTVNLDSSDQVGKLTERERDREMERLYPDQAFSVHIPPPPPPNFISSEFYVLQLLIN